MDTVRAEVTDGSCLSGHLSHLSCISLLSVSRPLSSINLLFSLSPFPLSVAAHYAIALNYASKGPRSLIETMMIGRSWTMLQMTDVLIDDFRDCGMNNCNRRMGSIVI